MEPTADGGKPGGDGGKHHAERRGDKGECRLGHFSDSGGRLPDWAWTRFDLALKLLQAGGGTTGSFLQLCQFLFQRFDLRAKLLTGCPFAFGS